LAGLPLICCFHIAQDMLGFGGWYDSRDGYSSFMFYFPFYNFLLFGPLGFDGGGPKEEVSVMFEVELPL
jgi:hypothetical protein